MSDDSDLEFDALVRTSKTHIDKTINQLRNQYEQSLKKQQELELKILELQSHRREPILLSKNVQCSDVVRSTYSSSSQTDTYNLDGDERFYNKVDDVVKQNNQLHQNIYDLQQKIEEMNSSQNSLYSDFRLKHAAVVEQLKISQEKREKSYMDRIQFLEEDRTASLCSLHGFDSSSLSSNISEKQGKERPENLPNISHLATLEHEDQIRRSGENILKHIQKALSLARVSNENIADPKELQKLKFEKENALKKCLKLDKQLATTKSSKNVLEEKVKTLEEELQSLRLFYNLHQSLSQEADLRDQYDNQVRELTERLRQRETELLASQRENDTLAAMMKSMEKKLARSGGTSPIMLNGHVKSSGHINRRTKSSSSQSIPSINL